MESIHLRYFILFWYKREKIMRTYTCEQFHIQWSPYGCSIAMYSAYWKRLSKSKQIFHQFIYPSKTSHSGKYDKRDWYFTVNMDGMALVPPKFFFFPSKLQIPVYYREFGSFIRLISLPAGEIPNLIWIFSYSKKNWNNKLYHPLIFGIFLLHVTSKMIVPTSWLNT